VDFKADYEAILWFHLTKHSEKSRIPANIPWPSLRVIISAPWYAERGVAIRQVVCPSACPFDCFFVTLKYRVHISRKNS